MCSWTACIAPRQNPQLTSSVYGKPWGEPLGPSFQWRWFWALRTWLESRHPWSLARTTLKISWVASHALDLPPHVRLPDFADPCAIPHSIGAVLRLLFVTQPNQLECVLDPLLTQPLVLGGPASFPQFVTGWGFRPHLVQQILASYFSSSWSFLFLLVGQCFSSGPTVGAKCSCRLTRSPSYVSRYSHARFSMPSFVPLSI